MFKYKGDTADADFSEFDNTLCLVNKMKHGKITSNDAKHVQARLRSNMWEKKE